jgi:predicted metal-binding protein
MGHTKSQAVSLLESTPLRIYREPWKGQLVLACGKCQKKLKKNGGKQGVASLKKSLKQRSHTDPALRLRVATISCLKLCPKGGVTVCTQGQVGRGECSIVYTQEDVDKLYATIQSERDAKVLA